MDFPNFMAFQPIVVGKLKSGVSRPEHHHRATLKFEKKKKKFTVFCFFLHDIAGVPINSFYTTHIKHHS